MVYDGSELDFIYLPVFRCSLRFEARLEEEADGGEVARGRGQGQGPRSELVSLVQIRTLQTGGQYQIS